jgi:protein O-mannosyl-transferase
MATKDQLPGRWNLIAMIALLLLTVVAYLPALQAGFIWDDDWHVHKPELRSLHGLWRIWTDPPATQQYYPLAHTAFWIQYMLWDQHALGFHVVNLLIHLVNTVLVWRLLRLLKIPGAMFGAGLFALHPVQVESVAWITELKNTLSGMFYFGALLMYFRFDPPDQMMVPEPRSTRPYVWCLALYVCALLSKTSTATLPGAILVIAWWKRGRLQPFREVRDMLPFILLGLGMGMFSSWFEKNWWGATEDRIQLHGIERVLVAGRAAWFYLYKLIWPAHLAFFYERWNIDPHAVWQYVFPAAVVAVLCALWLLRNRLGRGPLAAVLYFGGTLLPALGFVNLFWQVYTYVCDHMQYLACLGIFALIAACGSAVVASLNRHQAWTGRACAASVLAILAALVWRQCLIYHDLKTLYVETINATPSSWLCHYNLAIELLKDGDTTGAIDHYQKAISIRPSYVDAHYNLGNTYYKAGRLDEADGEYTRVLQLDNKHALACYNLANVLRDQGKFPDAIKYYDQAHVLRPDFEGPLVGVGSVYFKSGRLSEASDAYEKALRINPRNIEARLNYALCFAEQHDVESALREYRKAAQARPEVVSTICSVGNALANQGRLDEAIVYYDLALQLRPNYPEAAQARQRAIDRRDLFSR